MQGVEVYAQTPYGVDAVSQTDVSAGQTGLLDFRVYGHGVARHSERYACVADVYSLYQDSPGQGSALGGVHESGVAHADVQMAIRQGCTAQSCHALFQVGVFTVEVQQPQVSANVHLRNQVGGIELSLLDVNAVHTQLSLEYMAEIHVHHHRPRVEQGVALEAGGEVLQFYVQRETDAHPFQRYLHASRLGGKAHGLLYGPVLYGRDVEEGNQQEGHEQ